MSVSFEHCAGKSFELELELEPELEHARELGLAQCWQLTRTLRLGCQDDNRRCASDT